MAEELDFKNLNFSDLTTRQRQLVDYLQNLSNRPTQAIGTTGLTGREVQTAEELLQDAPSAIETGYGPKEFNPQQRYQTRFQQRGGITGPTPFESLAQSLALGSMGQGSGGPVGGRTDPGFGEPSGSGDTGVGEGFSATPSPEMQAVQEQMSISDALGLLSPIGTSAAQGLLGGASVGQALAGLGAGLKGFMTSPLSILSAIDNVVGASYGQHKAEKEVQNLGLSPSQLSGVRAAMQDPTNPMADIMGPQETKAYGILSNVDTRAMSTRAIRALTDLLGLTTSETETANIGGRPGEFRGLDFSQSPSTFGALASMADLAMSQAPMSASEMAASISDPKERQDFMSSLGYSQGLFGGYFSPSDVAAMDKEARSMLGHPDPIDTFSGVAQSFGRVSEGFDPFGRSTSSEGIGSASDSSGAVGGGIAGGLGGYGGYGGDPFGGFGGEGERGIL